MDKYAAVHIRRDLPYFTGWSDSSLVPIFDSIARTHEQRIRSRIVLAQDEIDPFEDRDRWGTFDGEEFHMTPHGVVVAHNYESGEPKVMLRRVDFYRPGGKKMHTELSTFIRGQNPEAIVEEVGERLFELSEEWEFLDEFYEPFLRALE